MSRNKYPEETVEKILDVSLRLFLEKGYEHTTLQDIIDCLGGLTKGAIYHHFKGKEDILEAIANRMGAETERHMQALRDDPSMNGLEKMRAMFRASLNNSEQRDMFSMAPNLMNNPKILTILMRDLMETVAPDYLRPILEEGVADGSIQTEYPEELGEAVLVLSNIWINPMIYPAAPEKLVRRIECYGQILRSMGLDIVDAEFEYALARYCKLSGQRLS